MKHNYRDWIDLNVPNFKSAYGKCNKLCREMQEVFPELDLVKGWYKDPIWGDREHWWLLDDSGEVVDPTAKQFPTKGLFAYKRVKPGDPKPLGKCMICGAYCYDSEVACSPEHERELNRISNI